MLVAHPEGELYRRAAEGRDLVPLAPHNEVDLATAWKLSRLIRQWKPQIVHAHDPHAVSMAGTRPLVWRADTAARARRLAPRGLSPAGALLLAWKYRQVDVFIAASDAIRDILVHDGIAASRIVVVHDGIDVDRIERLPAVDIHAEYWLPRGAPVIVNVGALVGHKGQRHLVDADAHWSCARCPTCTSSSSAKASCGRRSRSRSRSSASKSTCCLPGFREDVLSLVKSADLFVMSSVTEGLGSALLDAMAMGLAVVGTRAGGIPEAVVDGETGLLVPPGEPQPLAQAMVRLLNDAGLRRAYGGAGRRV